ncbi:MAG TPA: ABC transporter permease [Nitrososphaerales archaeon]|nr:ABC transporter permease [Nitrososphaerales archaeon]
MRLLTYVLRRLVLMVFVLFGLSLLVFYLARGLLPPSFALAPYITPRMDDATRLSIARGLDIATASCPNYTDFVNQAAGCVVPVWGQYVVWLQNALTGNWGYSLLPGVAGINTTWNIFTSRFPFTAELAVAGAVLAILIGIPLGIVSATHNNKLPDHLARVVSVGGYSVPQFWFGAVLQIVFVLYIRVNGTGLFPASSTLGVATACGICVANPGTVAAYTGAPILDGILSANPSYFWDALVALALPALTLAITSIGAISRIVRSSMMDSLKQDYITLARAKGLKERVVAYRHALRNALLPVVTVSGLLAAYLLGGVVVIEIVFAWPGVGNTAFAAAQYLDINFLELYVLVTAMIIVVINLVVDVIYAKLDPRIRY